LKLRPPIISDYKIITFGISQPDIEAIYTDNKFIQIKKDIDDIKAREFATALALRKAIKKLGIRNAISFHSSIRRANNFKAQQELISKVYPEYGKLKAFHVSGDMPTNQRSSQMREFAESKGLMTNARCLTEGVDLPAIDCVVFTDPKKSKVDIVQAAGRALRLSPGKKFGYILIPLIIPENENATEAAKDTAFEEIVATIRALATQDSRIIEYLRAVSSGTIPKGGSPVDGITKINVLTKVNEEEFNKSIQLKVWDRVAFGNWRPYEEAKKYAQSLNLKSYKDWNNLSKRKLLPRDLPNGVDRAYKEWESWKVFLGNNFVTYEEAKKYVQSLKLKNQYDWIKFTKSGKLPRNIPADVYTVYQKNFEGIRIFLGINDLAFKYQDRNYRSYIKAKKFMQSLALSGVRQWEKYIKIKKIPKDIPLNPLRAYGKSFEGWQEYLGNKKKYKNFEEAKTFIKKYRFKKREDFWKGTHKLPLDIPKSPNGFYKKEWKGWGDFLGNNFIATQNREYLSYKFARKYALKLKLKTYTEWRKLKNLPNNIPRDIKKIYKKEWQGLEHFFGSSFKILRRKFKNYSEAKLFAFSKNFKSQLEWKKYIKNNKLPVDIPRNPDFTYKNNGWKGWSDFLSTGKKPRSKKN
jgi:hypothetical protein